MKTIVLAIHISIAILLMTLVLLQTSKGGLGSAWGGEGGFYRTRRGAEKLVFMATVIAAFGFLVTSIMNLVMR